MEYGCIGKKLGHSFSAVIHAKLGNYDYRLCELTETELTEFMTKKDFKGINVTIPYKETVIPFLGSVDLGFFYYILAAVFIVGMVNAVNFTDGIDGLNTSVTLVVSLVFSVIAMLLNRVGLSLYAAAIVGAMIGFLFWNANPAKVFMGDTGSLFLGGAVCALAFGVDMPILLILIGIIYIVEILSVVLQVTYFKISHGKRIFKMAPIHHHFEMCGWNENKICFVFSGVTLFAGIIGVLLAVFGC